ncbi:MAG: (Fe-S)-binding protein [Actinobacteria bacterium]|nr:(Fe-S)-binding protein [Actinomycetota bacterium]
MSGEPRAALLVTCFNDTLFPDVGRATVTVLERLGCEVAFPAAQTCCGQMHGNSGAHEEGLALAARAVRVFAEEPAVVCPSASCVGWLRETAPRLAAEAGEDDLVAGLEQLGGRLFELTEFLCDHLGVEDVGAFFPHRVAYHPTCHSLRGLKLGERPLRLLRAVGGLDLAEVDDEDCCGFGGTFAVKNADVSTAMLADKMAAVRATGAEVCTAVDSSCLMQIGGGLGRARAGVRTMHLAEILACER